MIFVLLLSQTTEKENAKNECEKKEVAQAEIERLKRQIESLKIEKVTTQLGVDSFNFWKILFLFQQKRKRS